MQAAIYVLYALLGLSAVAAFAGYAAGRLFQAKFGLIAALTIAGIVAILPPDKKLKLGIDLSGGTILVYQVKDVTTGANFRMDDLIAALKRRVNSTGVADIPIRKIGSNRIEIIMAKASDEDVVELKRRLTDVGSLEFRILANRKHDNAAIERALAPGGLDKPPRGYKWAHLGQTITGKNPKVTSTTLTDPTQAWPPDRFAERTNVLLTGKDKTVSVPIKSNTTNTLTLEKPHALSSVSSYSIDYNPSNIQPSDDAIIRDRDSGNGVTDRYILVKLDRQNVTGEYLAHVSQTTDERVQPAVRFVFKPVGGRKFGTLTRDHRPEEDGAFLYRLAILLDDWVMSAPVIKSEIRDEGVIEGIPPKDI